MILSEFAGAAHSLNGSIIINPVRDAFFWALRTQWNTEELAQGIHEAMVMPSEVRKTRHDKLFACVTRIRLSSRTQLREQVHVAVLGDELRC